MDDEERHICGMHIWWIAQVRFSFEDSGKWQMTGVTFTGCKLGVQQLRFEMSDSRTWIRRILI